PQRTLTANLHYPVIPPTVTVTTEIDDVKTSDFKAIICIGAYAMDRLRYQPTVKKGRPNQAPAVQFLRRVLQTEELPVGTICHGLWLLCADRSLLKGRKVTCAHTIVCDVENAGAEILYSGDRTADLVVDGNLVSAKHSAV